MGVGFITAPVLPGTIIGFVTGSAVGFAFSNMDAVDYFLFPPTAVRFVGVVLSVWVIVWTVRRSDDGPNKYGPDPRQATSQQPYKP